MVTAELNSDILKNLSVLEKHEDYLKLAAAYLRELAQKATKDSAKNDVKILSGIRDGITSMRNIQNGKEKDLTTEEFFDEL